MPDLSGKRVLVTGASDGVGLQLTREFARRHAGVIMACRNAEKAGRARDDVLRETPDARLDILPIDLGDLQSVRACSEEVAARYDRVSVILCNAGLMGVPFGTTNDGFETHMGVNYLGHFALVGRLMPLIEASPGIRIVTASSLAEKSARLDLETPWTEKNYRPYAAYADSKLAMLMFALALDAEFRRHGLNAAALSAHPGLTRSNLRIAALKTEKNPWQRFQLTLYERLSMPVDQGTYPLLYAAVASEAEGGEYIGVSGIGEIRGYPKVTKGQRRAYDGDLRARLWQMSEVLTGVRF